jgi:hypothetical protein
MGLLASMAPTRRGGGCKPMLKGMKTERSLTNSGRVVHRSGMKSSGRLKARGSSDVAYVSQFNGRFERERTSLPRKTVYEGCAHISVSKTINNQKIK